MLPLGYAVALVCSTLAAAVLGRPNPLSPDAAGAKNLGNGRGSQFIGGACLNGADCASTCCATLNAAGICSGVGAQFQAGKQGCGFYATSVSTASSNTSLSPSASPVGVNTTAPGAQSVGQGNGRQFITGQCFSDADCASGCCAKPNGLCSAFAAQFAAGKQGCGFVQPVTGA